MIFTNDVHNNGNEDNDDDDQSQIQEILGLALLQVEQIACGSDSHDGDGDEVDDGSRCSSCDGYNHGIRDDNHLHILRIHDLDGVQTVNHWKLLRQVTGQTESIAGLVLFLGLNICDNLGQF